VGSVDALLCDHAARGEELDLARGAAIDWADTRDWPADREVSAATVRELIRKAADLDPRGVRLRGARLVGTLDLEGISTGFILVLRDCDLPGGVIAHDARATALRLPGCRINRPVLAKRLVASVLALPDALVVGDHTDGALDLGGAHLGILNCERATLTNQLGPAINGESLRVERTASLNGLRASGAGPNGAIYLLGAHAARLECDGATLRNATGPALRADSLVAEQRAFLRHGFTAEGEGQIGAVRLNGARLGIFSCHGATLRNATGPALVAESAHAERGAFLGPGLTAVGHGGQGVLRLRGTRVAGQLHLDIAGLRNTDEGAPLAALDGLTYTGLPEGALVSQWLTMLEAAATYAPQPYQQLAAGCRAAGQDREARAVLIAQRRDEVRRGHLTPAVRAWIRLTSSTLGYGYQPWRALGWLAGVVLVAVVLAVLLGAAGGLSQPAPAVGGCGVVQAVGVGLDMSIPLIKTDARQACDMTGTPAGRSLTIASWVLQLLSWAFATLFVAGFTSAVRRPG
jgi:hypothetical protein